MSYKNHLRVGGNLQTMPDDWDLADENHPLAQGMRDLFIADEGCYLFKADLKGADGWTIGAYMAMLGDRTMLDDLLYGLKPAHFPAYILKFGAEDIVKNFHDRAALKELFKKVNKDDWEYFVSKQGIWGTCYLMGPRKLAGLVFIQSEGKVNLSEKQAREFQQSIYIRYKVKTLHDYFQRQIQSSPYPFAFQAPNGHIRKFWCRKDEALGEVLAHMPQTVTTYATLLAAHRLWTDPENRVDYGTEASGVIGITGINSISESGFRSATSSGRSLIRSNRIKLRLEPLHQVHDELLMQARIEDTSWAIDKIKQYFNNPIIVAGQKLIIPFDGAYGTAWSMDEKHKVGEIK